MKPDEDVIVHKVEASGYIYCIFWRLYYRPKRPEVPPGYDLYIVRSDNHCYRHLFWKLYWRMR